jgi:hypothetical protein
VCVFLFLGLGIDFFFFVLETIRKDDLVADQGFIRAVGIDGRAITVPKEQAAIWYNKKRHWINNNDINNINSRREGVLAQCP